MAPGRATGCVERVISHEDEPTIEPNLYVITGAPGTGKTTLLRELHGITTVAEPAREIIAEQRAIDGDGVWDRNPQRFVQLLLERSIENYRRAGSAVGTTVFDRGIPDCVVYAESASADLEPSRRAAREWRYHPEVMILEPWAEIYHTDAERIMTFEMVVDFHVALVAAYRASGYELTVVPPGTVARRADFIRGRWDLG